jgi:hypothetical protein
MIRQRRNVEYAKNRRSNREVGLRTAGFGGLPGPHHCLKVDRLAQDGCGS